MAEKRKGVPDRRANRVILRRTLCLAALFGIGTFSMLIWKLWQIQIVNQDFYETKAIEQQTSDLAVSAKRGTIYDSQGQILAISATAYNVILSPRDLARVQAEYEERPDSDRPAPTNEYLAAGLSELLGTDSETLIKRMERDYSAYEVLASRVEEEIAAKVRQFVLDNHLSNGLYVLPDAKRHYPYSSLAAQVIGFVNNENQGAYGIEAARERELAGQRGRVITARTGSGTEMLSSYENYVDAVEGYNLHLTLDATIQYYAERVLEDGIARFEVRNGGFCVVMDPNTGAVYALASSPDYDLNNPRTISDEAAAKQLEAMKNNPAVTEEEYLDALGQAQFKQWWSKALNDTYEPGSTFKTLVLAAALEEGVVNESSTFYCSGSVQVPGWTIRCHKHGGHGSQTLREVVMNSCNPAFVAIGQRLGAEKFYQYLEDFGIIGKTGIDLPEANNSNLVWSREYFTSEEGIASLAAASFGQTFRLTPIQLATAASAAVNGGHLLQPYVVQSVEDENGNLVERREVIEARQVISEETSALVRSILESVVGDGGTGKNAYAAGYRIGGKTGTSEKRDEDTGDLIVSFLGVAPANDPKVVVLLGYDSPTPSSPGSNYTAGGTYISGGNMAAVMAGELISDILEYMGVEKEYSKEELSSVDTLVPKVTEISLGEAQRLLKNSGLAWRIVGDGDMVTDQIPAQGTSIPKNSQVVLYLGEERPSDLITVPDLLGRSPDAVQTMLQSAGLYLRATGNVDYYSSKTLAIDQSVAGGTQVEPGTVVEVRFIDSQIKDY